MMNNKESSHACLDTSFRNHCWCPVCCTSITSSLLLPW